MPLHDTHPKGPATILFTHFGDDWIRGSERCLLDLLTHIDRDQFNPVVWCNSGIMADTVRGLGITAYRSDFSLLLGWRSPRFDIRTFAAQVKQGMRLVDEHGVKLLHNNSGAPNQWMSLVARSRGLPSLVHLHARYPLRDRITLGLHQTPMCVGVSQPVIETLLEDGIPRQHTRVIANGIDTQRLDRQPDINLRRQLNLNSDDFLIATTGSLIRRKGIDLIIDALSRLLAQGLPAHLAVIGEGPEREPLQQQIRQLGIGSHVHLLGEQTSIAGLLRGSADLFVSGAREEVFGLVLAEAGLAGLPVIAPAVGGIPDVVADGQTGLLVPPEDAKALAGAIRKLYHAPRLRTRMGLAGRRRVNRHFTIERNVDRFERLYHRMLNDPAMHAGWLSHWPYRQALPKVTRRLFDLSLNRMTRRATS